MLPIARITSILVLVVLGLLTPVPTLAQRYDSQGKRDPFTDLLKLRALQREPEVVPPPPLEKRPAGLPGLLVSEVAVAGTATNGSEKIVVLKGVDNITYLARAGSRLFDGRLDTIADDQVVFTREIVNTRGDVRKEKVVKRFYTEDQ